MAAISVTALFVMKERRTFKFSGHGINPSRPPNDTADERAEKQRLIREFITKHGYTRVELDANGGRVLRKVIAQ